MIKVRKGTKDKQDKNWVAYEYNGNTYIEFIQPDDKERELLQLCIDIVRGHVNEYYALKEK